MKIAEVTAYTVMCPGHNDNGSLRHFIFCRTRNGDGTCGWDVAIVQFEALGTAAAQLVRALASQLPGRDRIVNVPIWRDPKRTIWWYGYRGRITSFAVGAIVVALWDLKGKLFCQPFEGRWRRPHACACGVPCPLSTSPVVKGSPPSV